MSTTDVNQLWELLAGVFSFNAEVFQQISILPNGFTLALLIVLISGLSQAIAESIILFINRVQPVRFIFSLLINAVLYTFGYLFLVFSSWLICLISSSINFPFNTLARVLGLSYAPLMFSFLGALPYLGVPILWLLSVWHLLAMVVGFGAVAQVSAGTAFWYVAFGWAMLQILQQTIGQPIANLGRWLANKVAGVELVTHRQEVTELVGTGLNRTSSPTTAPDIQQLIASARPRVEEENLTPRVSDYTTSGTRAETSAVANNTFNKQQLILFLRLLGMVVLAFVVAILLRPVREGLFGWYTRLPGMFRFVFDLVWIGIVGLIFAGLLAPLETLGWWAGWYNDEVNTTINTGTLVEPVADSRNISRYIIYLDGICQSTSEYLPDIEDFLDALVPALPNDVALIRGLMVYSVFNKPLVEDRPLGFLWRLADRLRFANPTNLLGYLVNLRNVLIVCVSADRRYGPLYNQGIAQVMYNALINNGYQPGSSVPVTLIGYSGGGQMSAASAHFLRRATGAPIDVISLGGVISGNCNILKLEHLYHLVGEKDTVEQLGPILFPGRWKLLPLSYWNRGKRLGKISFISLGPVGHQVPGGMLDPKEYLPDGRSHLEQTVDYIIQILRGKLLVAEQHITRKPSNYGLYQEADFNHPDYYPLHQTVDLNWYRPLGRWIGRLILPQKQERHTVRGCLFEVHYADAGYEHLVGQVVNLRWVDDQNVQNWVRAVTHDVHFSADAEYTSKYGGSIHPVRLNHWRQVDPLESLAGSRPNDDVIVMLNDDIIIEAVAANITLRIRTQPVQITGRYYGLIQFFQPVKGTDQFRVVHFNPSSRQFDGIEEIVRLPPPVADRNDCFPSTSRHIEKSLLNETGWYIYGAKDASGYFVVQSLAPRALMRLQPERVIFGRKPAYKYIRKQAWADILAQKGKISSVLLSCQNQSIQDALAEWQEGERALLLHTYGGIGGNKKEPAAASPIFFGHFAYGLAQVVREPLADELQFDINYYQIYTHNTDGLIAGTLHWSRYMGDRQFGWTGIRPVCDILVKLDAFTGDFEFNGMKRSVLDIMLTQLQAMTARYRIGDGTGGTYVGPAYNCAQDSNKALFASLRSLQRAIQSNASLLENWLLHNPEQARQYQQLLELDEALKRELQPFGTVRSDWEKNEYNLGSTLEDDPLQNLLTGLASWKTLLPRLASDTIVHVFLKHNAYVWVLRTNQIGGNDLDIEPIAPMTL
ncbi:CAAX protease [Chlorogloeopsis sp. ULAP02]|uniref:Yip1 family protein n=1 Tax=Chlorogloeopsis sp. ULAP02 TaxID=3107926 RepID=UPI0031375F16